MCDSYRGNSHPRRWLGLRCERLQPAVRYERRRFVSCLIVLCNRALEQSLSTSIAPVAFTALDLRLGALTPV